jgi:glycosyltransferase involved in cell wall biosynthesis
MEVSAVVCTRDRAALLASCLPTLLSCEYRPREIVVVDQSADGRTRELVAAYQGEHDDLRYIPTETRGLSAARNVAVQAVRGEVLAFTDDDCLADSGWLGAIAEEFTDAPDLSAVCGRSLPLVESPLVGHAAAVHTSEQRRLFSAPCSPWRIGSGSNMAFRTSALRSIGPFDERLGPGAPLRGGEEADVLYRLLKRGRRILYSPRPLVYHRQWRDRAQQLALSYAYGVGIGAFGVKHLRAGDLRMLRTLGGWTASGFRDLGAGLMHGDRGAARSAARLLAGLAAGSLQMALAGSWLARR